MEILAPILTTVILAGVLIYALRARDRDRDIYLRAVEFSIREGMKEREATRQQIADLTEKIQHPEIRHPPQAEWEPGPVPEPDPAFEHVGKIYPEDNGGD